MDDVLIRPLTGDRRFFDTDALARRTRNDFHAFLAACRRSIGKTGPEHFVDEIFVRTNAEPFR
jgi:hypothetical protein